MPNRWGESHADDVPGRVGLRPSSTFVVALGASAGGLEALREFFAGMPADCGIAFVIVTHQLPSRESRLAELLAQSTEMAIADVSAPTVPEAGRVYTAPSGHELVMRDGRLEPLPILGDRPHMPIDAFFRSLARDRGDRAIAVILSGTGSDGTLGLKEIKAELGMVIAQEEASASFSGMPHSAIATQLVDVVLPARAMAEWLFSYVQASRPDPSLATAHELQAMSRLLTMLNAQTGNDFSQYKRATVQRRVSRRMHILHLERVVDYVARLETHPEELEALFKDLLIGVTSFFRDPEAWLLVKDALRGQLARALPRDGFRAWIAGCATGEEAYSLAIVLRELLDELELSIPVQIFATDLDAAAIQVARVGLYSRGVAADVSAERLERFFSQSNGDYLVSKHLRDMVVFAVHNVIGDYPFTKLDILSCRNVLIYLEAQLQQRLMPLFHYALNQDGLLFLGSAEWTGSTPELFNPIDKKWKVFQRRDVAAGTYTPELPLSIGGRGRDLDAATSTERVAQLAQHALLEQLVPASALVRRRGDVVYVHGRTGLFLEPAPGPPRAANIFNMARPGLGSALASILRRAATSDAEVVETDLRVVCDGVEVPVELRAMRVTRPEPLRDLTRISFIDRRVPGLETGLAAARPTTAREETATHGDNLSALADEQLQQTNEELQSTNEELETSKEEMHVLSEELQTVNAELQGKVEELSKANDDMKNLLNGTNIAALFLDEGLRIRSYTQRARDLIRVIPTDIGRPIADLASSIRNGDMVKDAREVLRTLVMREREVRTDDDSHYLMRVFPYRNTHNIIDGLVLTFVDLTRLTRSRRELEQLLGALEGAAVSVYTQRPDLYITWASSGLFGRPHAEVVGRTDHDLLSVVDADALTTLKRRAARSRKAARERLELGAEGGKKVYDVYVEPQLDDDDRITSIATVMVER